MSVTIAGIRFDHHDYDERGDVLDLSVEGYEGPGDGLREPGRPQRRVRTTPDG
jgi:hypothetical protein